jgi:hypothetical protein
MLFRFRGGLYRNQFPPLRGRFHLRFVFAVLMCSRRSPELTCAFGVSQNMWPIGHEGSVGLSVCKVHISATRWRLFTLTAVALRFCRAIEKTPSSGGNKRRATAKSLNALS